MRKDVLTPFNYKAGVEAAFADSSLRPKIIDVFIIPDFSKFIWGAVDGYLSHLHTLDFTQLQWIFEYHPKSRLFPYGVKTTYRRYSSDRVCEICERHPDQCTTTIGKATGLEPYAIPVTTFPTAETFPDRDVEGFCLLTRLPCTGKTPWEPSPFDENTKTIFDKVYNGVMAFFPVGSPERNEWEQWLSDTIPRTSDTNEYLLRGKRMKRPLEKYFNLDTEINWFSEESTLDESLVAGELREDDWQFPNMNIAFPQASVVSRFDINPPDPLVFHNNNSNYVSKFTDASKQFNKNVLGKLTVESVKEMLRL